MADKTKTPMPDNPELLDKAIGYIQLGLVDSLPWLDKAYGRAERLVRMDGNGRRCYTPNVYAGGNDYVLVTPDSGIGNFCFFWVDDPQEVAVDTGVSVGISTRFSIIFWLDYRKIFNTPDSRDRETVKRQILDVLNGGFWMKSGSFRINRVYELAENIYKGFSLDEISNQFLMAPYGGFRFEGEMKVTENCI